MSQLRHALGLLLPLLSGGGTLLLLLIIYWPLRRRTRARALGLPYLVAMALLGALLFLDGAGLLAAGLPRNLLVAALLVAWGYILFDLVEELLVRRAGGYGVPRLGRDILRGLALIALVLLAVNRVFGVPLSSLVISSTVASAVLGLALQDLLKDVIAGVALQTERPFGPGDWLLFAGQPARVIEMNWRATRLVTVDRTHIVVPNAAMAQAEISNYSLVSPLQALHVQIPLSPDHPPNQVKQLLNAAAAAAEGVLSDPPPGTRLVAYGEYSVTYDVKFWMQGFERHVETRDAVMTSGAPRRASVYAAGDTQALLVSREALAPLLARNPALPERLSAILEQRVAESQSLLADAASASAANGVDMSQPTLLRRIRSMFGLS